MSGRDVAKPIAARTKDPLPCRVCGRPGRYPGAGLCSAHYERRRKGLPVDGPLLGATMPCPVAGCAASGPATREGLCDRHNERKRKSVAVPLDAPFKAWAPKGSPCTVNGCAGAVVAASYCALHVSVHRRARSIFGSIDTSSIVAAYPMPERCQCCGDPAGAKDRGGRLHLDHDHHTGRLRGFLCQRCNLAAGFVGDDDLRALALARYLSETRAAGTLAS